MIDYYDDENDKLVYKDNFTNLVSFIENEIKKAEEEDNDLRRIHNLKRRLNSLKSSFVEWYVGGLAAADRDNRKAAIEDAVMNCRSAARYGVGYGANFEGMRACFELLVDMEASIEKDFINIVYTAYRKIVSMLYNNGSFIDLDDASDIAIENIQNGKPKNILNPDMEVLSSIESDRLVLSAMDKIISIMATSNQYVCPEPMDGMKYILEAEKNKKV